MGFRAIHTPVDLTDKASNISPAAQRGSSISHDGHLSGPKTYYTSLQSSSCTASDDCTRNFRTHTIRHTPAVYLPPLSNGHVSPYRQRHMSISMTPTYTGSSEGSEDQKSTQSVKQVTRRRLSERHSTSAPVSRSCASLLLWYARQQTAEWLGRKTSIMDIVLGLRLEYDEATLLDLLQRRCRDTRPLLRQHTFTDAHSLDRYWADQAANWNGIRTFEEGTAIRFPDSEERSTASWTPTSNSGPTSEC